MFNPYHKWLGIAPKDQPPNHYRLLAVDLFEPDPDVIDAAANRQMAYVQQQATGQYMALSQKLLNELSAARLCLLDAKKRQAYDAQLRKEIAQQQKETDGSQGEPLAEAMPAETGLAPNALPAAIPFGAVGIPAADPLADLANLDLPRSVSRGRLKKRKKSSWFVPVAIAGVAASVGIILLAIFAGVQNANDTKVAVKSTSPVSTETKRSNISGDTKKGINKSPDGKSQLTKVQDEGQGIADQASRAQLEPVQPSSPAVGSGPESGTGPSVGAPPTDEKPAIKKTLSQEEEEVNAASAAAKSKEDYRAVTKRGLALADRAIVEGNAEMAKKAVRQCLVAARNADSANLSRRATQLLIQLQGPLSESLKDEARKRLSSNLTDADQAGDAEERSDERPKGVKTPGSPTVSPQALSGLSGLAKDKVEKGLREMEPPSNSENAGEQSAPSANNGKLAKMVTGMCQVALSQKRTNAQNTSSWDFRPDNSVWENGNRIATWAADDSEVRIRFTDTSLGKAKITFRGKGVFVGTQTYENGDVWTCTLMRLSVVAVGEHWLVRSSSRAPITLWSNGHINDPDSSSTWERNGILLVLHWSPGNVNYCTLSPDGRTYRGGVYRSRNISVEGTLTWKK